MVHLVVRSLSSRAFYFARFAGPDSAGGSLWKRPWLHVDELIHIHLRWSHDEGISFAYRWLLYPEQLYPEFASILPGCTKSETIESL